MKTNYKNINHYRDNKNYYKQNSMDLIMMSHIVKYLIYTHVCNRTSVHFNFISVCRFVIDDLILASNSEYHPFRYVSSYITCK